MVVLPDLRCPHHGARLISSSHAENTSIAQHGERWIPAPVMHVFLLLEGPFLAKDVRCLDPCRVHVVTTSQHQLAIRHQRESRTEEHVWHSDLQRSAGRTYRRIPEPGHADSVRRTLGLAPGKNFSVREQSHVQRY